MSLTAYIYFDVTATITEPYFILDDPVQGVLDSEYVLGGDIAIDVTDQVLSLSVRRGRNTELDVIDVGSAQLVLNNDDRDFDPTYTAGPFYGEVKPWKRVEFLVNGKPIFTGHVEDWNFQYTMNGDSDAMAVCVDTLAYLGATQLAAHTATAQLSGERIAAVLNRSEVRFGANRDLDSGVAELQADVVTENTSTLPYLQGVAKAEHGYLFAGADGVLRFRQRSTALNTSPVVFADDGTGISYSGIAVTFGSELLYNRVTVERVGGTAQTAENADSQDSYGVRSLAITGLLYADDGQAAELAEFLANSYSEPTFRITQVSVDTANLTGPELATVLDIDISDLVSVKFQPPGPTEVIERSLRVEGISHELSVDFGHVITFDLSDVQLPLILDDDVLGVLDANVLGF